MTDPSPAPVLLPVSPFARSAGLSDVTVRRLIRCGAIRAVKIGRALRIPSSELSRLATTASTPTR